MGKPLIDLALVSGIGLIVEYPSGVLYSNQTGGVACHHPSIEGVFLPLTNRLVPQEKALWKHFFGEKYRQSCSDGIDEEDADIIDAILRGDGEEHRVFTQFISVDRERLTDSYEAWVFVNLTTDLSNPPNPAYSLLISGFGMCKGVLTWRNSD